MASIPLLAQCIRDIIIAHPYLTASHVSYIAMQVRQTYPGARVSLIEHLVQEAIIEVRKNLPRLTRAEKRRLARAANFLD